MKICIIGAGITGLTLGRLLSKKYQVTIYEREPEIGGIAKTKTVDGVTYHPVGGHCFNSKNKAILDFVFNEVLPKENFHLVKRDAKILFKGHIISYPIEFSVKEIAEFDEELAFNITKDFFSTNENIKPTNLAEYFKVKFGETLAKEYFIPYNRKIWGMDPADMSYLWVKGKLPQPDKRQFFKSLIKNAEDDMPHRTFYYPNSNNQNTFIAALAKGLNIITNFLVKSIERRNNKWLINGLFEYDIVISTMPLNILPFIIKGTPIEILEEAKKLKYNKITTVLWKSKPVKQTWTYLPSPDIIFHRVIHIGNFFQPKQNYSITEAVGEHSYKKMVEEGYKIDFLTEPIAYNVSDHAYVVFDQNYLKAKIKIMEYLNKIGIYTIGRFGEWEYYNMDVCMERAFILAEKLESKKKC